MNLIKLLFIIIGFTFLNAQECAQLQELYKNQNYRDAYDLFIINPEMVSSAECQYLAFQISFNVEDFDKSSEYLNLLLLDNPDNSDYKNASTLLIKILQDYKAAKYTLEKVDTDEAISEYKQAIENIDLSKISIFYNGLGNAYKKKDKESNQSDSLKFNFLDLAVENYNIANTINAYKGYDESILNISKILAQKGKTSKENDDYNSAMLYFKKSTEYSPNYSKAHFLLGELYFRITDFQLAIKSLQTGLGSKFKEGNPTALYMLGKCHQRIGNLDLAKQYYEYAINNKPSSSSYRLALANILFSLQEFSNAENTLFDIISLDPSYIKAYELLVNVYIEIENLDKAREYSNIGLDIDRKSKLLFAQLAFMDNEEEQYESSIDNSNKALSIDRKYGPALIQLGRANVFLCNKVKADDAFKRARSYDRRQVGQLQEWAKEHLKSVCK